MSNAAPETTSHTLTAQVFTKNIKQILTIYKIQIPP